MEMNMGKFSEKLVGLLELAKKKKNVLEYQEISDYFKDQPLDAEQMDKIFDFLEASGVDVLRITENLSLIHISCLQTMAGSKVSIRKATSYTSMQPISDRCM